MTSLTTPLLVNVASAEDWPPVYERLRAAPHRPEQAVALLPEIDEDLKGRRRWLGRRYAMRRLTQMFAASECEDLRQAAKLLATNPEDGEYCADIRRDLKAGRSATLNRRPRERKARPCVGGGVERQRSRKSVDEARLRDADHGVACPPVPE